MIMKPIIFDLSKRFPNVLFLGNGLFYNSDFSWINLIKKLSKPEKQDLYDLKIPNTLLSLVLCDTDDYTRYDTYIEALNNYKYSQNQGIEHLLKMPFDAIMTTNYTYNIENAIDNKYPYLSNESKNKKSYYTQIDSKFLIHTYNKIGDNVPIWHIHGELRRKSSMILSHDEYARLVEKILCYNRNRKDDYQKYFTELKMKSWIDYFIMGNIYFLGYSLDFSEFDIWWLLGRRLREKARNGNVYFYEASSKENEDKHKALEMLGVNVITLNYDFDIKENYDEFYMSAIEDIKKRIFNSKEEDILCLKE